jgi:hypothetical protein
MSLVRPRAAVFVLAAVLAAAIAYDLWRTPVQVSDSLSEILASEGFASTSAAFTAAVGTTAYLRPLRIAQIKALYDLGRPDRLHLVFRGFHVLLMLGLVAAFVAALKVETVDDASAAAFALLVLTGLHTFLSFVREAFPINHFLEIALLALVALNLSVSRGGWWVDLLAALVFAFAALTLESGLLVWVVIAAAWVSGCRGVSGRGLALVTVLLAAYLGVRFFYLDTGVPSLAERSSGFLLERLDPPDLQKRFGDSPRLFWAYNVVASWVSVFLSEPREGVFELVRGWREGEVHPRLFLWVVTSVATTVLMAVAALAWGRRPSQWTHAGRLAFVAMAVIAANAVLSFAYTKDDIITVAGVFYAFAAYAAVRGLLTRAATWRPRTAAALAAFLFVIGAGWAMRSLGVHHVVVTQAFNTRNDWALVPITRRSSWPDDSARIEVIEHLRQDALRADVPNTQTMGAWQDLWWGDK